MEYNSEQSFKTWWMARYGSELLPIIPPGAALRAGSTIKPEYRGKTPGIKHSDGLWSGLTGKWSDTDAELAVVKRWAAWGCNVGLQARKCPGLDIDVEDGALADAIEDLANDYLGFGPVRVRAGSHRRLITYSATEVIRKTRLAYNGGAVELLGRGQQYVVAGVHPSGSLYSWRGASPCENGPDSLTPITPEDVARFFAALGELLAARGLMTNATTAGSTTRRALDADGLQAPSPQHVLDLLKAWRPEHMAHDEFVAAMAAIKAALGPDRETYFGDVLDWAPGARSTEYDETKKRWDSIEDSALGWAWLQAQVPEATAQADFDDNGGALAPATPYDRVMDRFVWVRSIDRYADLTTGDLINATAFEKFNSDLADYGESGKRKADAIFQNARDARKAMITTYRPGQKELVTEQNENGVAVKAVNLWRKSDVVPMDGATDDDVAPWLDLITKIFGAPGEVAREHFLNWAAFAVQFPGHKINHALVLIGPQGVGKDTSLSPVWAALGTHNVKDGIKPSELEGQFTDFLEKQVIVVQEMHNFRRLEMADRLKDWIAAPPDRVRVNRKHLAPYSIPNIQLWVFTSNHEDAISLEADDRRYFIHKSCIEERQPDSYFDSIRAWYRNGGFEAVAGWLKARDLTAFNPFAPPPSTEAKEDMIRLAMPVQTRWLREQIEDDDGAFKGRTLLTVSELVAHTRTAPDASGKVASETREKHASAALRLAGYRPSDKKFRLANGMVTSMWGRGRWDIGQREARFILAEYERERVKGEAKRAGA